MAKALRHIDITNRPELLRLVREAQTTKESLVFQQDNEDVAILRPVRKAGKPRVPRGKPFTKDDALFHLIGIAEGKDDGIHDVSENVDKYLADAYADLHE